MSLEYKKYRELPPYCTREHNLLNQLKFQSTYGWIQFTADLDKQGYNLHYPILLLTGKNPNISLSDRVP